MSDRETLDRFMHDGIWRPKVLEAAIRGVLKENERLREGKALWSKQANDLEARIDAALAVKMPQPNYEDEEVYEAYVAGWDDCMGVTIEALKGEK